eukprot:CAMPEP_0181323382 /NCGR_PEP_ID=MMETSP1101-20121128/19754_1 /TAXON_ID=46948 /ORGANISM="Rhodomonas abbreviata, Strain Caron Lab Isolate" /LENGTH=146 /DNA_ID=CAMNT_0023431403 /DNA_START=77 /DNA_END=518 /DNA_ORIENTATION=-
MTKCAASVYMSPRNLVSAPVMSAPTSEQTDDRFINAEALSLADPQDPMLPLRLQQLLRRDMAILKDEPRPLEEEREQVVRKLPLCEEVGLFSKLPSTDCVWGEFEAAAFAASPQAASPSPFPSHFPAPASLLRLARAPQQPSSSPA